MSDTAPSVDEPRTPGPRARLMASAIDLMRERGVAGTGIAELLERSNTARRSIYQHFPGGKSELMATAVTAAGAWVSNHLETVLAASPDDPAGAIRNAIHAIGVNLARSDYQLGCPIAAAAAAAPEEQAILDAAARVFESWAARISTALVNNGWAEDDAPTLAGSSITVIEGAILRSRATRSTQPLDEAAEVLAHLYGRHG